MSEQADRRRDGGEVDPTGPVDAVIPGLYEELRRIAAAVRRAEGDGALALQTTAVVHEAYLRLVDQGNVADADRTRFLAAAASVMRRVLVDDARRRRRLKRGAGWQRVDISGLALQASASADIVDLCDLLQELARVDSRSARIVELKLFAGLTDREVADSMGLSAVTVRRDVRFARAWIRERLTA